jgi:prevent-host-death family protein
MCYDDHMEVGIRELKARLSEHLERVGHGEVLTVTSRGRRVAQIIPVPGRGNLERGLAEGWITRRAERPPEPIVRQRPVAGTPTTTELISQDRGA